MEHRYCVLRAHLDELGYMHPLSIESVPLVDRLLGDLVKTTESLHEYKNIAQSAIEERDHLQYGAEPYKCDNAKLVKECNDLHLAFLQFREQTEKLHRDLKHRINLLEREKQDLLDYEKKSKDKISKQGFKRTIPSKTTVGSRSAVSVGSSKSKTSILKTDTKQKNNQELEEMMALAEQRITNLAKEVKRLKMDHSQQIEMIDNLQYKLSNRDKEIQRLTTLLEGGRPLQALNKDCCYKDVNLKLTKLSEENNMYLREKRDLEMQLDDAIARQHEAMKRALHLAERNKQLERELRDIDKMALAVEADCDTKVKKNAEKFDKIQEKLDDKDYKIENLERQLNDMNRKRKTLELDLDSRTHEKERLQEIVESAIEDKKRMTDRINQFTRIEHDLNLEIDRLVQVSTLQKRKIAELECQMVTGKFDKISEEQEDMDRCINDCDKVKHRKSRQTKCMECEEVRRKCRDEDILADQLKTIRDQNARYYSELKRVKKELDTCTCNRDNINSELKHKLCDKEQEVKCLQQEIREMVREKQNILTKLEHLQDLDNRCTASEDGVCLKNTMARLEKERDLARADVRRLEIERDSLRERLKITAETNVIERSKLEKIICETEEKLHSLETERRELVTVQGSRRATINNLEEQVESLTDQLRSTVSELTHLQTLYSQLKALHDQTDRALADTQAQLTQIEMEYSHAQDRIRELEKDRMEADNELGVLRNDVGAMRSSIAKLDSDKDALLIEVDNKTETIALLEQDLKCKDCKIAGLETQVAELTQTLCLNRGNEQAAEHLVKTATSELNTFKRDLDAAQRAKNSLCAENRRLQDDLAVLTMDKTQIVREMDMKTREIEDLKKQLQEYVYEVKRAEDLLEKKEDERAEMLHQFHSLSQEATTLENNNHSLESQAYETKTKLNKAMDQITDLKQRVEIQNTLVNDFEVQIKKLTGQIACMESQLKQNNCIQQKTEAELISARELCVKLDQQKDCLLRDIKDKECLTSQLEAVNQDLRAKLNCLENKCSKGEDSAEKLERLLNAVQQENLEQKLINSENEEEIHRLRRITEDLKAKQYDTDTCVSPRRLRPKSPCESYRSLRCKYEPIARTSTSNTSVNFSERCPKATETCPAKTNICQTHPYDRARIHCTFTTSGPTLSSYTANYSISGPTSTHALNCNPSHRPKCSTKCDK